MTKQIEPVTAWAAIRPNGTIDPASIHQDRATVIWFVKGKTSWRPSTGWTIRQVEIRVKEEG